MNTPESRTRGYAYLIHDHRWIALVHDLHDGSPDMERFPDAE
jgi:hypothetical protein